MPHWVSRWSTSLMQQLLDDSKCRLHCQSSAFDVAGCALAATTTNDSNSLADWHTFACNICSNILFLLTPRSGGGKPRATIILGGRWGGCVSGFIVKYRCFRGASVGCICRIHVASALHTVRKRALVRRVFQAFTHDDVVVDELALRNLNT